MNKDEKKELCSGCKANRYNMGKGFCERPGIDAEVTCDECWNLAGAKVVSKEMCFSPADMKRTYVDRTLSCWHNNFGSGNIVRRRRG